VSDPTKAQVEALGRRAPDARPDEIGFAARNLPLAAREELDDLGGSLPHVTELIWKIDALLAGHKP
jgi:hypothetical protein